MNILDLRPVVKTVTPEELPWTSDQLDALAFLKDKTNPRRIVFGSAGTGKTSLVAKYIREATHKIIVTAPTHKAVKVLADKVQAPTMTTHGYLGLKLKRESGRQIFTFDEDYPFEKCNELIIDEASMVSRDLLQFILLAQSFMNFTVTFLGDEKQLPPVNEDFPPVFGCQYPSVELTTIVRQDNDIIDLSRNLHWIAERKTGDHFGWLDPANLDVGKLVEANGSDYCKFLTWTNKSVANINNSIRRLIYGADVGQFETGETILIIDHSFKITNGRVYRNNDEVNIERIIDGTVYNTTAKYPHIKTQVINDDLVVVHHESLGEHQENLNFLAGLARNKQIRWSEFYGYKESFAHYQYNHAITVHKAQGSTYNYSIINASELLSCRDNILRNKLLYTAVTRAKHYNYFI